MLTVPIVLFALCATIILCLEIRIEWVYKIRQKIMDKEWNLFAYLPSPDEMIYKYFAHWSYDYFINLAQQRKVQHDKKRTGK